MRMWDDYIYTNIIQNIIKNPFRTIHCMFGKSKSFFIQSNTITIMIKGILINIRSHSCHTTATVAFNLVLF